MSTSDTEKRRRKGSFSAYLKSTITAYIIGTAFCLLFGAVYELFSHGVMSPFMYLAFLIPLAGGVFVTVGLRVFRKYRIPAVHIRLFSQRIFFSEFINGGIIWLTAGSLFKGVLDIYGTTNRLSAIFPIVGGVLTAVGIILFIIQLKNRSY